MSRSSQRVNDDSVDAPVADSVSVLPGRRQVDPLLYESFLASYDGGDRTTQAFFTGDRWMKPTVDRGGRELASRSARFETIRSITPVWAILAGVMLSTATAGTGVVMNDVDAFDRTHSSPVILPEGVLVVDASGVTPTRAYPDRLVQRLNRDDANLAAALELACGSRRADSRAMESKGPEAGQGRHEAESEKTSGPIGTVEAGSGHWLLAEQHEASLGHRTDPASIASFSTDQGSGVERDQRDKTLQRQSDSSHRACQQAFLSALSADVVLIGELHGHPDHHEVQRRWLIALAAAGRMPILAMEIFDLDDQPFLDAYSKSRSSGFNNDMASRLGDDAPYRDSADRLGAVSSNPAASEWAQAEADRLAAEVGMPDRGWPWASYRPIVAEALNAGWPILGINLSSTEARQIAMEGLSSVQRTEDWLASHPVLGADWPETIVDPWLDAVYESHCRMVPREHLGGFLTAQRARDFAMALTIAERLAQAREEAEHTHLARQLNDAGDIPGRPVVVATLGYEHARRDFAVPAWLETGMSPHPGLNSHEAFRVLRAEAALRQGASGSGAQVGLADLAEGANSDFPGVPLRVFVVGMTEPGSPDETALETELGRVVPDNVVAAEPSAKSDQSAVDDRVVGKTEHQWVFDVLNDGRFDALFFGRRIERPDPCESFGSRSQ